MSEFVFDTPKDDRGGKPLIPLKTAIIGLWIVVSVLVGVRVLLSAHGLLFHFSPSELVTWVGLK